MGKKTNATSTKAEATETSVPLEIKARRSSPKSNEKKRSSLKEKAVKAVAAVAAGVGGAIAAKRKVTAKRNVPKETTIPSSIETIPSPTRYTHEDIALRAYFIAQNRANAGRPADPTADWLEAERQLAEEASAHSI